MTDMNADKSSSSANKQDVKTSNRKPRKSKKEMDYSRFSTPVMLRNLTVQSLQVQRIIDREEKRLSKAFYQIDVVLQITTQDEDSLKKVSELMNGRLLDIQKQIKNAEKIVNALLKENGIDSDNISYSAPSEYEIKVSSPLMNMFINTLLSLDKFICILDAAWMNNLLPSDERSDKVYGWQQALHKVSQEFIRVASTAYNRTQKDSAPVVLKEASKDLKEAV